METFARAFVLPVYVFWTTLCDGTPTYPTFTTNDVKCMFDSKSDPLNCPELPGVGGDNIQCKTCWVGEVERCVHSECSVVNPPPSNWNLLCKLGSPPDEGCPKVMGPSGLITCSVCEIDGVKKCIHVNSDCSALQTPDPCSFYAALDGKKDDKKKKCEKDWACEWDGKEAGLQRCKTNATPLAPVDIKVLKATASTTKADVRALKATASTTTADVKALKDANIVAKQKELEEFVEVGLAALRADVAALQEENTKLKQQLQQVNGLEQRVKNLETDISDLEENVGALTPLGEKVTNLEENVGALQPLGEKVTNLEENVGALQPLGEKVTNLEENVGALTPQVVDITADVEALQDANGADIMVKGPFHASTRKYYTSTGDGLGYGQFETPVLFDNKYATSFCALHQWSNTALKSRHGTNPRCQLTAGVMRDYDFTPRYGRWAIYKKQDHADGHIYCGATCLDGNDINFVKLFNLSYRTTYALNAAPEAGIMFCGLSNVELFGFFNEKHDKGFDCQLTKDSDSQWTLKTTSNVDRNNGPYNNCEATCVQSTKFKEIVISPQVTGEWPSTSGLTWQREEFLDFSPTTSYCALTQINQQVFLEDTSYGPTCTLDVYNGKYRIKATTAKLPNNLKAKTICRAACVTW